MEAATQGRSNFIDNDGWLLAVVCWLLVHFFVIGKFFLFNNQPWLVSSITEIRRGKKEKKKYNNQPCTCLHVDLCFVNEKLSGGSAVV
jgi:hypothetical protein